MTKINLIMVIAVLFFVTACASENHVQIPDGAVKEAKQTKPLDVGAEIPDVTVLTTDGETLNLKESVKQQKTVLIFYRGGWCPYCYAHLAKLQSIEKELKENGYRILAISPDKPERLLETIVKKELGYTLLSDRDAKAAIAFGLAFYQNKTLREFMKPYGIDLYKASGQKHYLLPVPAAYVIGTDGYIKFAYYDTNYKNRIDPESLLKAALMVQ